MGTTASDVSVVSEFPTTGEVIQVNAKRGALTCEVQATSEWTGADLCSKLEKELGIHRSLLKLSYGARPFKQDERLVTLLNDKLQELTKTGVNLQLRVDKSSFPEKLGPFSTCAVPLKQGELEIGEIDDGVWNWEMHKDAQKRFFQCGTSTIIGYASPVSDVTLDASGRSAACIPEGAVSFAWSYPLDPSHMPKDAEGEYEDEWFGQNAPMRTFLSAGGHIYFDDQRRMAGVTTNGQWREDCDKGGMHFGEKMRFDSSWLPALQMDARFQNVALDVFKSMGATEFCWLCTGEKINVSTSPNNDGANLPSQPEIPHGGFAFFFAERPWLNCYFPLVAPPDEVLSSDRPLFAPPAIVNQTKSNHGGDTEHLEDGKRGGKPLQIDPTMSCGFQMTYQTPKSSSAKSSSAPISSFDKAGKGAEDTL